MKSKLTIIILLFFLWACHTTRTTTETKKKVETTTNATAEQERKTEVFSDSMLHRIEGMTAEYEFNLEEFDTTQPIDTLTGLHPLKKRITAKRKVTSTSNQTIQAKKQLTESVRQKQHIKTKTKAEQKEKTTTRITYPDIPYWVWIVLIIIAIIIYLYLKFLL